MYYSTYLQSPIGELLLVSNSHSLIGVWLSGQKYFARNLSSSPIANDNCTILQNTKQLLNQYFKNQQPNFNSLPLAPQGTDFQKAVWEMLLAIPYGRITTYGNIAKHLAQKLNKPQLSAQAVGNAIAHNPISIIIPCHRVLSAKGEMAGYAGGIANKQYLLQLEGINLKQPLLHIN